MSRSLRSSLANAPPPAPTTATATGALATAVVSALQAALQAEHRAIYVYAALGPQLGPTDAVAARANETAHRAQRDRTSMFLRGVGVVPASSAISYVVPAAPTVAAAQRFARTVENAAASAWRYVIAEAATAAPTARIASVRANALTALTACAVRALRWSLRIDPTHPTVPFPGD